MALKFGTSGVRGLASELTDLEVAKFVRAFLRHASDVVAEESKGRLFIADDFRQSSPRIAKAAIHAAQIYGYQVEYLGHVPTPALALFSVSQKALALMVTGSHIPADRNGLKFYMPSGEILKSDEQRIFEIYQSNDMVTDDFGEDGMLLKAANKSAEKVYTIKNRQGYVEYVNRYIDFFGKEALTGKKVILYEHSAVGREVIGEILEGLGAGVIRKGYSKEFIPVDTEALTDVQKLRAWIASEKADALVSTDGDSDRPFVLDETGEVVRGDELGALVSSSLGATAIALPVSCNSAVSEMKEFSDVEWTKIGSPFVISGMEDLKNRGCQGVIAGYEANGGFLLGTDIEKGGSTLGALHTRDAVLPMVVALKEAKRRGISLSQLTATFPKRATYSGSIKGVPSEVSQKLSKMIASDPGKFCVEHLNFVGAELDKLDATDGTKLVFANKEVVFFRPSGNAPELRCYTEAKDPQRARQLNESAILFLNSYISTAEQ